MTDAEVALELTKLVVKHEELKLVDEKEPRKFLLDLYRECLDAVRKQA